MGRRLHWLILAAVLALAPLSHAAELVPPASRAAIVAGDWWVPGGVPTRVFDGEFTVADTATNLEAFQAGRAIRFRGAGGDWYYAVSDYAASGGGVVTVGFEGAPMTVADDDEVQWSATERIVTLRYYIPGTWAAVATNTLLADDLGAAPTWRHRTAYCVSLGARVLVQDTGGSEPHVNAIIGASPIVAAPGILTTDGAYISTGAALNPAVYGIVYGDPIELTTDAGGTNNDSNGLSVTLIFVLE